MTMWDTEDGVTKFRDDAEAYAFLLRIMRIFNGFDGPSPDNLWWRTDGKYAPFTVFVNCNDEFYWASADCEEITPENIEEMERAVADCIATTRRKEPWGERGCSVYAPMLFCARVRKMRPMGAAYPGGEDHAGVRELLNACGPERAVGLGNLQAPPAGETVAP